MRCVGCSTQHEAHSMYTAHRQWSPPLPNSPLQQRSAPANKHVAHAQQSTLRASNAEYTLHRQKSVKAQNTQHSTNRAAPHPNCARRRHHRHRPEITHRHRDRHAECVYSCILVAVCCVCCMCCAHCEWGYEVCMLCEIWVGLLRGLCVCVWAIGCVARI